MIKDNLSVKKFEVIENNRGSLILVVFDNDGLVDYLHGGYEFVVGELTEDLQALKEGANPVIDWDDNEDEPQAVYDNIKSFDYGWNVVADNDGIYIDKMSGAAKIEFNAIDDN